MGFSKVGRGEFVDSQKTIGQSFDDSNTCIYNPLPFHGGNRGSNPRGDATNEFSWLAQNLAISRVLGNNHPSSNITHLHRKSLVFWTVVRGQFVDFSTTVSGRNDSRPGEAFHYRLSALLTQVCIKLSHMQGGSQ